MDERTSEGLSTFSPLSWMELKQPGLIRWLCMKHPGQHKIKFGYYRLIEWLKRQINPSAVWFSTS